MEGDFRVKFEEILRGLKFPGQMPVDEQTKQFNDLIDYVQQHLPKKLFRYRTCTDYSIDGFLADTIYSVKAAKFNDPYDSLMQFDPSRARRTLKVDTRLRRVVESLRATGEMPVDLISLWGDELCNSIRDKVMGLDAGDILKVLKADDVVVEKNLEQFDNEICEIEHSIQSSVHIACFSEEVDNMLMWSHYSDYHKGFALEYDFHQMGNEATGLKLFPVVYSDKRYDAGEAVAYQYVKRFAPNIQSPDTRYFIKTSLFKSKDWMYENEWRLLSSFFDDKEISCDKAYPKAIYYGCRISSASYNILHNIAQQKNIVEYKMKINNASESYKMEYERI